MLATRLRSLREREGFSRLELAKKTKLSLSYVSKLEQGTKQPTVDTLDDIAKALGVSLKEVFQEDSIEPASRYDGLARFFQGLELTLDEIDTIKRMAVALKGKRHG